MLNSILIHCSHSNSFPTTVRDTMVYSGASDNISDNSQNPKYEDEWKKDNNQKVLLDLREDIQHNNQSVPVSPIDTDKNKELRDSDEDNKLKRDSDEYDIQPKRGSDEDDIQPKHLLIVLLLVSGTGGVIYANQSDLNKSGIKLRKLKPKFDEEEDTVSTDDEDENFVDLYDENKDENVASIDNSYVGSAKNIFNDVFSKLNDTFG